MEDTRSTIDGATRATIPADLKELRAGYAEIATPVREGRAEVAKLEKRLSNLVNEAYGLIPEEVDPLWSTAHVPAGQGHADTLNSLFQ